MLKRTGIAKIVDIGSAFELRDPPPRPHLHAGLCRAGSARKPRDDAAERPLLARLCADRAACRAASRLPASATCASCWKPSGRCRMRLHEILPEEVLRCELLCTFIRGMIAADPVRRFPSAEAADLLKEGAAAFPPATGHRQPGQRVRQRHSPVAGRAERAGRPGRRPQRGGVVSVALPSMVLFSLVRFDVFQPRGRRGESAGCCPFNSWRTRLRCPTKSPPIAGWRSRSDARPAESAGSRAGDRPLSRRPHRCLWTARR